MPESPAAEPRRALRRQDSSSVAGTGQAWAGACASTSGLSASTDSWGLRLGSRSSASVAPSPAVSERLAAESSPRWTSASARAALRSTSASAGAHARPADASSGWEASRRSVSHSPRLNASARRWHVVTKVSKVAGGSFPSALRVAGGRGVKRSIGLASAAAI